MALVACPECQHRVSSAAAACPSCGHPMRSAGGKAAQRNPVHAGVVVTTERTSKVLKAHGLLSMLLLFAGLGVFVLAHYRHRAKAELGEPPVFEFDGLVTTSAVIMGAAIIYMACVAFLTWWRHD